MLEQLNKTRLIPCLIGSAAVALLAAPSWAQQPAKPPAKPAATKSSRTATATAPASAPAVNAPRTPEKPVAGPPDATGTSTQGPKVTVERGAGGKKVYRITDALRIEGKIQKPEAFYVLQKSSINYDWQDLKQDFIPKIFESVAQAPF